MVLRVSSSPASFGSAFVESPGCPGSPPQASPLDRFPGSPRFLDLPAAPAMVFRVSSNHASFSGTGGKAPGFPESLFLQHRLLMRLRVSPHPASSGCADGEFPGIPDSRSIGCAVWWISGSPRLPHPTAAPSMRTQASLNPAYTVGSMMTPHLNRTLHPRARPRMNLRLNQVLHIPV
jgi:hypothetical protein